MPNPTILPSLLNSMNSTRAASSDWLAVAALCGGTTLPFLPSVADRMGALRDWGSTRAIAIFGAGAHATAHLAMTGTILSITTHFGCRADFAAVASYRIHGIVTDTALLAARVVAAKVSGRHHPARLRLSTTTSQRVSFPLEPLPTPPASPPGWPRWCGRSRTPAASRVRLQCGC